MSPMWTGSGMKSAFENTLKEPGGKVLFRKKQEFEEWKWYLEVIEEIEEIIDPFEYHCVDYVSPPYYEITANEDYGCKKPHGKHKYKLSHIAYETVGEFFKANLHPVYEDEYCTFFNDIGELFEHMNSFHSKQIYKNSPVIDKECILDIICEVNKKTEKLICC